MDGSSPESDPKFKKKLGEFLGMDLKELKKIAQEIGPKQDPIDTKIQEYLGVYHEEISGTARRELIAAEKELWRRHGELSGKKRTVEDYKIMDQLGTRIIELEAFTKACNRYAGFQWSETRKKVDGVLGIKKDFQVDKDALSGLIPRETYFSQFIRFTEDEKREYQELIDKHPGSDNEGYRASQRSHIHNYDISQKIFYEFFPQPDISK